MIPLSVPHLAGNEWKYVKDCLDTGWISSAGSYVGRFEEAVAELVGLPYSVACMNGTAGLHLALRLVGVGRDDLVVVPNITFIASANAVAYLGATPVLIDIDAETWQMDLDLLETFLTDDCTRDADDRVLRKRDGRRVAAIMPVHVLGNMCDVQRLGRLAEAHGLPVVEDATEALGSRYDGRAAGTFSNIGVFSFNGNKIISTGGGGVLVTADDNLAKAAKHLSTQAKPDPLEYYHDEIGYNYRLVNVLAAIGVAQMEQLPGILERKRAIDATYRLALAGVGDIRFQQVLPECEPNCWLFTMATDHMRELLAYLNERGVQSRPLWVPMNRLPMFAAIQYVTASDCSGRAFETCISIPSSGGLAHDDAHTVIDTVRGFFAA